MKSLHTATPESKVGTASFPLRPSTNRTGEVGSHDAHHQRSRPSVHVPISQTQDRLAAIAQAKAKIEARAKERFEREQAEYQAKLAKRAAKEAASGKKPGGKPPQPPQAGARSDDQINLTDEESRIMKVAGGGFDQCYNAQGVVDTESMLVIAPHVTQACNDKEQVDPMVARITARGAADPDGGCR